MKLNTNPEIIITEKEALIIKEFYNICKNTILYKELNNNDINNILETIDILYREEDIKQDIFVTENNKEIKIIIKESEE